MILSDHWLIANNYTALRFLVDLIHPEDGDAEPTQLHVGADVSDVCTTLRRWMPEDTIEAFMERLVHNHRNMMTLELSRKIDGLFGKSFERIIRIRRSPVCGQPIIRPFHPESIKVAGDGQRVTSYGLSSYGYDVTLAPRFKLFTNINSGVIDPLDFTDENCVDFEGESVVIPPNSYMLGVTNEYFCIPDDILVIAIGKSTYARAGAIVNVTPIEPGFEGNVVIEISNATPSPLRIHANMGIAQFCFFKGDQPAKTTYRDRAGKYQGQTGITLAKV
jgi:dCTP deaminase